MSNRQEEITGHNEQPKPSSNIKSSFYQYVQNEMAALQKQIDKLADSQVAEQDRNDSVEECLAGIAKLSQEVKDASTYLPAYDQKMYSENIKTLGEKLQSVRNSVAPKSRFKFTRRNLNNPESRVKVTTPSGPLIPKSNAEPAADDVRKISSTSNNQGIRSASTLIDVEHREQAASAEQNTMEISHKRHERIVRRSADHNGTTGSVADLQGCVVVLSSFDDSSIPVTESELPKAWFNGLYMRAIEQSLVVCGAVRGPAHVTGLVGCVIVVTCRQFRMHQSSDTDVYLSCGSRPIIEDCQRVRFAPLPSCFSRTQGGESATGIDMWNEIDDFKWLKAEPSPNWSVMPEEQRIQDRVWISVLSDQADAKPGDLLESLGRNQE